ncbi:MAG: hypothetical protein ACI89L_000001 [Phycisphaerales bacterium]|jgi:hypothetical protein
MSRPYSTRTWFIAGSAIALVLAAVAGVRAWRPGRATDSQVFLAEAGQGVFDTLGSLPLDDQIAVRVAFDASAVSNASAIPAENRDRVAGLARRQVADLFASRFGSSGPDDYLQTWERDGYRLATRAEMDQRIGVESYYEYFVGTPPSPDAESRELFGAIWRAIDAKGAEPVRLTSIAADPGGIHTVFYRINVTREQTEFLATDLMDGSGWYGAISQTLPLWFLPPLTIDDLFDAGKTSILISETGVVADFARGGRRVVNIRQFWDTDRKRWWIYKINANNFTTTLGGPSF